jgi:hypothetical protein
VDSGAAFEVEKQNSVCTLQTGATLPQPRGKVCEELMQMQNSKQTMEPEAPPKLVRAYMFRRTIAFAVVLVVSVYTVGIVLGRIPQQQKLSATDVGLVVVTAVVASVLLRPELLNRLTHFKFGSFEADWKHVKEKQQTQERELDAVRFVLTFLLQQAEKNHLENLVKDGASQYEGNHAVRSELRKLRTLGLIENRKDHTIAEMKDGHKCDLKDVVQLTERGRDYLERKQQEG